jgi:cytochrome b pre-mRNA-processing protein 3
MFQSLFKRFRSPSAARALYAGVVRQAREPALYRAGGVADTEDGRYDMILLHMFLILDRLNGATPEPKQLKQDLFDVLFEDLDVNLREMGFGDEGVRRRIQKMVEGFYGRMTAYREGLEGGDGALQAALRRNLFRNTAPDDSQVQAMAGYVRAQVAALAGRTDDDIVAGNAGFAAPDLAKADLAAGQGSAT